MPANNRGMKHTKYPRFALVCIFLGMWTAIALGAIVEKTTAPGQSITLTNPVPATWNAPNRTTVTNATSFTVTYSSEGDRTILVTPGDDVLLHVKAGSTTQPTPPPTTAPSAPPATMPTAGDSRPVVRVVGDGLQAAIEAATTPRILVCSGLIDQTINKRVIVRTDKLKITQEDPARRVRVNIRPGYALYNGIYNSKSGFEVVGFGFYTNATTTDRKANSATPISFTSGGSGSVRNCFADNVDQFINLGQGCHDVQITDSECTDRILGQGVWGGGSNILIARCTLRSRNEHPIRFGDDGLSTYKTSNVTIRDCTLIRGASSVKECLSLRKGAGPFLVDNTVCRVGEVGGTVSIGYGIRLGYKTEEGQPRIGPVTFTNVKSVNGWMDVKPSCRGATLKFDVDFSGDLKVKPPLQLNGAAANTSGTTSTSGVAVKP